MRIVLGELNGVRLANLALNASRFCSSVDAAVAYASGFKHPFLSASKSSGMRVTFYGLFNADDAVDVGVLKELLSWGPSRASVRLVKGHFHSKVIWWRGFGAYIGSANLTQSGWFNNIEAGVFLEESELESTATGADLEEFFDHLAACSFPVTDETIEKLGSLAQARADVVKAKAGARSKFDQAFAHIPDYRGLITKPPKGHRENASRKSFVLEWMNTLQLMRGLGQEFHSLQLRPSWVDRDAHPTIHFDQFLHAYYYDYVRSGAGMLEEDDEDSSGLELVEKFFARNRQDPGNALKEAARWWAALPSDRYGEERFIREIAPSMRERFAKEAVATMTPSSFTEALRHVNAFRVHARQVKNSEFGLPDDHHETLDRRVERLCAWLWERKTPTGRSVRDALEFVLWGSQPAEMENRLWLGIWGDDYRLPHFGKSTLGEAVGWARPDDYPPRNNRTNKALRSLGHDVKLFSKS